MLSNDQSSIAELAEQAVVVHKAIQIRAELEVLIEFLMARPTHRSLRALEIGSEHGGTLWLWARLFDRVTAVDIKPIPMELPANVNFICGNSHDADTVTQAAALAPYDFIFIDADHSYEAVKRDFELYRPLLVEGGIMGFHDVCSFTKQFWIELQQQWYSTITISAEDPYTNGIGIVLPDAVIEREAKWHGWQQGLYSNLQ